MKYIIKIENFKFSVKLNKKFEDVGREIYPFGDITPFINWFVDLNDDKMKEEGWLISDSDFGSSHFIRPRFNGIALGGYWQIQKDDEDGILYSDEDAEKSAKDLGLLLDDEGVVIGYNGVSFLEHPEELEVYKNANKYNL